MSKTLEGGTGAVTAVDLPPPIEAAFVGRSRELDELARALAQAQRAHGQLFLVSGEPGIGKTRIAEQLCTIARERGMRVVWGRCWEAGDSPPYWPWLEVLRDCIGDAADASRLSLPALLHAADPHSQSGAVHSSLAPEESELGRFALFDTTARLLKRTAEACPLVIVLDDLHAADEASLRLLQFVARTLRGAAILVIGTYRDAEVRTTPRLSGIFGEISRDAHTITLRGLSRGDVAELVRASIGRAPEEGLLAALHRITGGNPFFLTETIRLLAAEELLASGTFESGKIPISDTVRSAIRKRLDLAPQPLLEALRAAAAIGVEFGVTLLQRTTGVEREVLLDLLGRGTAAGILDAAAASHELYRFTHSLIRETIYGDLNPAERARLHHRIALAMEDMSASNPEPYISEIAHHYIEAHAPDASAKTIDYVRRAAKLAMDSLAYEEAVRLCNTALRTASGSAMLTAELHYDLLMDLGEALYASGLVSQARRAFEQAGQIARKLGDSRKVARAALGRATPPSEIELDQPLVTMLEEALASSEDLEVGTRARMLARLGSELKWTGDLRASALAARAVELARNSGDPLTLIYVLYWGHVAMWSIDNLELRIANANEAIELAERVGDKAWALKTRYVRFLDLLEKCDVPAADADLARFSQLTDELRLPFGWKEMASAERALMDGRLDDAEKSSLTSLEIGRRMESRFRTLRQAFTNLCLLLRREQGRSGEMLPAFRAIRARHPDNLYARCALAWCFSETGESGDAQEMLDFIAGNGFESIPRNLVWYAITALLSEVCTRLRDRPRAEALYALMAPYAARNALLDVHVCYGPVARYLGMLSAVASRFEAAQMHFEAALELSARMGARLWLARTRFDYASMMLEREAAGDRAAAIGHLDAAIEEASSHGLKTLGEQAAALRNSVVGSSLTAPPSAPRREEPASANIFRKEGEVWHIAWSGRSFRLKDSKGLAYIAYLLRYPGQEFHVLDMIAPGSGAGETIDEAGDDRVERKVTGNWPGEGYQPGPGDAGEMLDARAKGEFKRRITELREQLDEAREVNDEERARKAEDEIDALSSELSRAVGLGGRDRRAASATERARINVTRAVKSALGRIAANDRELGATLDQSIRTGTFCSYDPSDTKIAWDL